MRKNYYFAALAAAAMITLGSCNNDSDTKDAKYITVSTSIDNITRVVTDADGSQKFANGDQISVYAWTGDAATTPAADARVVNNAINTLNGATWTAAPQMLWKDMKTPHYFIGVYPKNEQAVADLAAMSYQLDVKKQEQSDLLVAVNTEGKIATTNPVNLSFDHVMAQLTVNLTYRTQFGENAVVESVKAVEMSDKASVNLLTKVVTAGTDKTDVALPAVTDNSKYSSIVVPQTGFNEIQVVIDGKTFIYKHNTNITLESGKMTTVNLIVGRDEITLGSVNINPWSEGTELDGDALD